MMRVPAVLCIFTENEGTLSRFRSLREGMEANGCFSLLYTD